MKHGFTLIEIIVVVAITGVMASLGFGFVDNLKKTNHLDIADTLLRSQAEKTRLFALGQKEDSDWGLRIENQEIIVFKGSDFSGRDTSFDNIADIPGSVSVSGLDEVIFTKLTSIPNTDGTITFTSLGSSINLYINEYGAFEN